MTVRKLGIIGGLSWSSTALYYQHINRAVAARLGGLHSAELAIESLDFAPLAQMQQSGDWSTLATQAVTAARRLEEAGAQGLLIASNIMHKVHGEIAGAVAIPVLHIADAAAARMAADGIRRAGLLGTETTMTGAHVRSRLEQRGIAIVPLAAPRMRELDRIIYQELAAGRVVRESQRSLKTMITELAKARAEAVLLACTELALAIDIRANVLPVYDSTAIHAQAAVDWMLEAQEPARAAA